jgi:hypothetical protein
LRQSNFTPAVPGTPIGPRKLGGPASLLGGASQDNGKLEEWLAQCPRMDLASFVRSCMGKGALPAAPWAQDGGPVTAQELVSILCALGAFEPLGATRPGACDLVTPYDKIVEVPPASIDMNGKITPSTEKLVRFCAPQDKSLVIHKLRGTPANLTAATSGQVFSKVMQVMGFSEGFCPPGEPGDGNDLGTFQNIEHVVLCPGSGFDLHARNSDPYSPALFHVSGESWATC